jgi:hypothetical protein
MNTVVLSYELVISITENTSLYYYNTFPIPTHSIAECPAKFLKMRSVVNLRAIVFPIQENGWNTMVALRKQVTNYYF